MKKNIFVILALLVGMVGCDSDIANQTSEENASNIEPVENTAAETAAAEESFITPADMSEEAQNVMYQAIFDYNQCMLTSRLTASQDGQSAQEAANDIMSSCETHINDLEAHLLAHNVYEPLAIGMTKKMRSRAARKLMTQGMNHMAAQAAAVVNAERAKAKAESASTE